MLCSNWTKTELTNKLTKLSSLRMSRKKRRQDLSVEVLIVSKTIEEIEVASTIVEVAAAVEEAVEAEEEEVDTSATTVITTISTNLKTSKPMVMTRMAMVPSKSLTYLTSTWMIL